MLCGMSQRGSSGPSYKCCCGLRHSVSLAVEADFQAFGTTVVVPDDAGGYFRVPRVYIAVHGLRTSEVGMLAETYAWQSVAAHIGRLTRAAR